ncbi:hypothetical protein Leryth_016622 [Lithospermum erythrorhizon]|nr:hypothetical protein Leryth_016622 [Lithospermum erythrorhizon]
MSRTSSPSSGMDGNNESVHLPDALTNSSSIRSISSNHSRASGRSSVREVGSGAGDSKPMRHGSKGAESDGFTMSQREISDDNARLIYINDPVRTYEKFDIAGNSVRTSKYSVISFLPRNLFEQFHRVAYVYFLVIAILNQLPQLAVFGRGVSILPLAFVLFVTAVKDAYEDYRRHRSDRIENNRLADVWVDGQFQKKRWKEIRVGEIVKVSADETMPCDMVVLSTSDSTGVAYVQTINLDGESNLKTRYAKQETQMKILEKGGFSGLIKSDQIFIAFWHGDKTGTLTENKMEFQCASIGGVDYRGRTSPDGDEVGGYSVAVEGQTFRPKMRVKVNPELLTVLRNGSHTDEGRHVHNFFLALAACNTIVPLSTETSDPSTKLVEYQGESPDEQALAYAAAAYGYMLIERTSGHIILNVQGEPQNKVTSSFENKLIVLGASAIEDKLQEGVPEAIESLRIAGIKVWVLTGDKQETAISIGYSSKLLTNQMTQIVINNNSKESCRKSLDDALTICKQRKTDSQGPGASPLGLIIDGTSLVYILDSELEEQLFQLASRCDVVLCCRVAPLQKAGIVALIKNRANDMTLAIGDGANDVSMIQMADVGIGISR